MSGNPTRRGYRESQSLSVRARGGGRGSPPSQGFSTDSQYQPSRGGIDRSRGGGDRGRGRGGRGGFSRGRGGPAEIRIFSTSNDVPKLDMRIMRIENESETAGKLKRTKSTLQKTRMVLEPQLPQRPGFGTKGRAILLWTNYFSLTSFGNLLLYRYSVDVLEAQGGRSPTGKKLKRVVQLLLEECFPMYGHEIATDFKSNLISKTELDQPQAEYTIAYRAENEEDVAPNARTYRVRLQITGTLTCTVRIKDEIIQILNIVVGHHPKAEPHIASIGANKHFRHGAAPSERFDLGAGLMALRGFFVSVRAATARILVNVQVKHGAFYDDGPLAKLMNAFTTENGPNKVKLGNFVKRLSVQVTHIVRRNRLGDKIPRMRVVMGLAMRDDGQNEEHPPFVPEFGAGSKEVMFFLEDPSFESGEKAQDPSASSAKKGGKAEKAGPGPSSEGRYISVYDYFKKKYNITIREPHLPVVNIGSRQSPNYLPPQVCEVLPGQPSNSKLTPSQTQKMIRFAVRKPAESAQSIVTAGASLLGFNPNNPTIDAFGLSVEPKMTTVPGRILTSPDVKYHGNQIARTGFGSWNMQSIQFATRADLPYWTYLWISAQGSPDPWGGDVALKTSLDAFTSTLRQVGVNANDCVPGLRIKVNPGNAEAEIDKAIHLFTNSLKSPPPMLILVILPSLDSAIYNRIKYACDVREGLLNVCVVGSKFAKANAQYHANVALKINLKLGGRNQFLDNSKLGILAEGRTMVVGIDVTHPSPGSSSNAPSVASIVASVDQWLAQWPADLRIQPSRQEMVSDLESLFKSRLRLWMARNHVYPENILVYRDGVSEGQYNLVLEQELPSLRRACAELYPPSSTKQSIPRITIIIVGKRHNTRFYPTKKEDADRSSNPQNGTIVDRGVTEARNWDFFLQAHTAIQGTARPAHYYIIYDQIFQVQRIHPPFMHAADVLEDLTHNLCYLFGRATKAVSICPPAYYANLACERARCYLSGLFDPSPTASPTGSVASGGTGRAEEVVDPSRLQIHKNVRDSMFYI